MRAYIVRRLLMAIPTMLVTALTVSLIIHLTPGDPASVMLGDQATPEQLAQLQHQLGLDRPIMLQIASWLWRAVRGDLGYSYFFRIPVSAAIAQAYGPTVMITCFALLVAVTVGVLAGVISAVKRGTLLDDAVMLFAILGVSLPEFWLGLNLILLFAVTLRWFPVAGYQPLSSGVAGALRYAVLPALALGLTQAAFISRMVRSAILEVLDSDYVRTARGKGLPERKVVFKHILRNAMVPIFTVVGLSTAILLGGAVTTETVFNIPGIGRLLIDAALRRDYPTVQGIVLLVAFVYSLINLSVDLSYAWVDPRVRYS